LVLLSFFPYTTLFRSLFTVRLEEFFPSPLSTQVTQVFSRALVIFSQASPLAKLGTLLLAVLLGSNLFSLMEACFDVIYHLPPRRSEEHTSELQSRVDL